MTHSLSERGCASVAAILAVIGLSVPAVARAQSNLSTQGFGFPPGQFSSRALGTGGAIAEMDPLSAVNPAAVALLGARILFFQIEPEYRTVTTNNGSERTTTARYPLVFGAIPVTPTWVFSLGSSTLLDRTSTTTFKSTQAITGGDVVPITTKYQIDGAMNDIRLASGWAPVTWLRVGVGAHAVTGHNLVTITQAFTDSTRFAAFTQQRLLSFSGVAASAGVDLVSKQWLASASARLGGTLRLSANDTSLTSARVPNRFGAAVAYTGVVGSTFSVRTSYDKWSSMGSLGLPTLHPADAWDSSIGADVAGPRFLGRIIYLRGGYRMRTLPFLADGDTVSEKSLSVGAGTSFASGHVLGDIALIRASRSVAIAASERAWTISIGLSVRP